MPSIQAYRGHRKSPFRYCGAEEAVSQPKVPLESGIACRKLAAKRRKNAAHGASRGWKVENDRAPEERKKSCDTDSSALSFQVLRRVRKNSHGGSNRGGHDFSRAVKC